MLVLDEPRETKNGDTCSKGQDIARNCRGPAETELHGSHGAIRKGLLEFGPAELAAFFFVNKTVPHRFKPHNLAAERDRVDTVVLGPETIEKKENTLMAKQYLTASLAIVMMTGISVTGCRAPQQTGMGKTAVASAVARKAMQMWRCEMNDGATEEQVMKGAQEWLAAAKTMKGGKDLELYAHFPVAVNATAQIDVVLMLVAPSFKKWGEFWDGYGDSPAADVEEASEAFIICPDSVLWESSKVKTP